MDTPYEVVARNIDPDADNAIHDDEVARTYGFPGALVPGVELFAYAAEAALAAHGQDWLRGGRLALRFRRPVHDGERLVVQVRDGDVVLHGPGGEPRAVGVLRAPAPPPEVDASTWPRRPLPDAPLPPEAASLPAGPLGTVQEAAGSGDGATYAALVEAQDDAFLDGRLAHPGLLLRMVNLVLMRNVALGPWIHTSSDAVLLAPAALPGAFEVRAQVRETYDRRSGSGVRYDALVLADGVPVLQVDHTALFRLARR